MKATINKIELSGTDVEAVITVKGIIDDFSDGYSKSRMSEDVRKEIKNYLVDKLIEKSAADILNSIDIASLKNAVMLKTANIMVRGE